MSRTHISAGEGNLGYAENCRHGNRKGARSRDRRGFLTRYMSIKTEPVTM